MNKADKKPVPLAMRFSRWIFASLAVLLILCAPFGLRLLIRHWENQVYQHKTARHGVATVLDKKYVTFAADQSSYQNEEGRAIPIEAWRRKEGEYRIFYRIDSFNGISDRVARSLLLAENARALKFGPRFRVVDEAQFNQAADGQPLSFMYRWADDSHIELISVEFQR